LVPSLALGEAEAVLENPREHPVQRPAVPIELLARPVKRVVGNREFDLSTSLARVVRRRWGESRGKETRGWRSLHQRFRAG